MSWFDDHRGALDAESAWRLLNGAIERAGVAEAVRTACGRYGLRRFVLRFEHRAGRVRLVGLLADPLPKGGGPPPGATYDAAAPAIEAALTALPRLLPPSFGFHRGALGVVRDADGRIDLRFRFDDEADALLPATLRLPAGAPHPVEDPAWIRVALAWDTPAARVRARWEVAAPGEVWVFRAGRLERPGRDPRRAEVLARYRERTDRFEWWLDEPAGDEAPLVDPVLELTLGEVVELVAIVAARRGCVGVFQGEEEQGDLILVGLKG